jgi:hypothetical protein
MINHIPVSCKTYQEREETCPILQNFPLINGEGETGPGIDEYPIELCVNCGHSMIEANGPTCLNCHQALTKQGSGHTGSTPKGSYHEHYYKCHECNLNYYSHGELF